MSFIRTMTMLLATSLMMASVGQAATECISKAEMQEIASHFTQFASEAKGDYCLDGSQTANLISALMYLRKTEFLTPMTPSSDELFSGRFGADWYQYFIGRIDDLEVVDSCPKGVGAYVYLFGGKTMYICPMMLTSNFSALDRASIMMHEARHIDGYPHVTCQRGPRAGLQGACDSRIADGGSYAVTVETYAQVAKYGKELHPAVRAYARSSSVIYADEAFDTPTRIQRETQFLAMDKQKHFYRVSLNNGVKSEALGEAPELGKIVMRAQHMILFPDNRNAKAEFLYTENEGSLGQEAGDLAKEYNSFDSAQRATFVDLHIGAQWNARVYGQKARLQCNPRSENTSELALSGTPVGFVYPTGYSRADHSALLLTSSGTMIELGCNNGQAYSRPSTKTFDRTFKRVYKVGDKVLALTPSGELFEIRGERSMALSTPLNGSIYEIAPNQTFDFYN